MNEAKETGTEMWNESWRLIDCFELEYGLCATIDEMLNFGQPIGGKKGRAYEGSQRFREAG